MYLAASLAGTVKLVDNKYFTLTGEAEPVDVSVLGCAATRANPRGGQVHARGLLLSQH